MNLDPIPVPYLYLSMINIFSQTGSVWVNTERTGEAWKSFYIKLQPLEGKSLVLGYLVGYELKEVADCCKLCYFLCICSRCVVNRII